MRLKYLDTSRNRYEYLIEACEINALTIYTWLQVFHELARHLQTRRLLAGDTLNLDSDKSFYIVVDGSVQVFAQTGSPSKGRDAYDDEDDNGYQLLNNVENGGTLSSLFTILSLFTEDVKLRYEDDRSTTGGASERTDPSRTNFYDSPPASRSNSHSRATTSTSRDPDVSEFNLDAHNRRRANNTSTVTVSSSGTTTTRKGSSSARPLSSASFTSSTTLMHDGLSDSTEAASPPFHPMESPSSPQTPDMSGYDEASTSRRAEAEARREKPKVRRSHAEPMQDPTKEGTIARATVDTTLAVIPAEAFRRLTKKFPNAAACVSSLSLHNLTWADLPSLRWIVISSKV